MLKAIYDVLEGHEPITLTVLILILSRVVDVSPIPISPWKWLYKLFIRKLSSLTMAVNSDIREALDDINMRLVRLECSRKVDKKEAIRRSIIRFADECRINVEHSQEMYTNALKDIDDYEKLCADTKDPNSVIEEAINVVKETNHHCFINNKYL